MTISRFKLFILFMLFFLILENLFAEDNKIIYKHENGSIINASIGKINGDITEEELSKLFGKENLVREVLPWNDGYSCVTTLFKKSAKELSISWRDDKLIYNGGLSEEEKNKCKETTYRNTPYDIHIESDLNTDNPTVGSYWKTDEGVHAGISLLELEKLNGVPIDFESSESCFNGGILNYHGGKLESRKNLLSYSTLHFDKDAIESYKTKDTGIVSSKDLPVALKEKIFLSNIELLFPFREGK